jgi:hypothetical protein
MARLRQAMDVAYVLDSSGVLILEDSRRVRVRDEWSRIRGLADAGDIVGHDAAVAMLLRGLAPTENQVSIEKFGSNDGWIVTPVECRILVAGLARLDDETIWRALSYNRTDHREESVAWVREYQAYCQHAVVHGGFEVW